MTSIIYNLYNNDSLILSGEKSYEEQTSTWENCNTRQKLFYIVGILRKLKKNLKW